jgi:hypothetical protein
VRRIQPRRIHLLLTAVAVAALAGCSKADAPPTDSAAAAAAQNAQQTIAPAVGSGAAGRAAMPGALVKPIDDYTGDELYELVRRLTFTGGQTRQRGCKNDPGCGSTKRTTVAVAAVATQDSIGPTTMPQYGVVYVRAINTGDAEEARYSMVPNANRYEYYLIITNDTSGKAMQWRLEQLDTTPGARRHSSAGTGRFVGCNHPWKPGARADFKTCANSASANDSIVRLGLALQGAIDDPMWTECGMGCCEAR